MKIPEACIINLAAMVQQFVCSLRHELAMSGYVSMDVGVAYAAGQLGGAIKALKHAGLLDITHPEITCLEVQVNKILDANVTEDQEKRKSFYADAILALRDWAEEPEDMTRALHRWSCWRGEVTPVADLSREDGVITIEDSTEFREMMADGDLTPEQRQEWDEAKKLADLIDDEDES